MIDKWIVVGSAHFAVAGILLKLLGYLLPCYVTSYYTCTANFLLYLYAARFTFEFTKKWHMNERVQGPENRAVFITGCDSGFGHNLAKRLDSIGYPVFAGCLDEKSAGAKELKRTCSKSLQVLQIDVTQDTSVKNAVDYVKDNLGTSELWAIVNNAGILRGCEVELSSMQDFKDVMEVNGLGPVRVTRAFLPLLRQSRGRVVNVTSLGGRLPLPYCTPYIMSKHAAVGFNDCLRIELDVWGIQVISIEPEFFKTGISDPESIKKSIGNTLSKLDPDVREDYGEKYIKSLNNFVDMIGTICSGNINAVVDAMDDAISLQYPSSVYRPCRNCVARAIYYILERSPTAVFDTAIKLIINVSGYQKPREAENYL